ncbi:MAG: Fic family protein [Myxococcales bacterium]|nr:MAG: Fic family protein [Myxococcales bacterium]
MRAIIIHFWLAYDHPFVDGNGRTARALFYWSMLRSEYWLFEYISISNMILEAPKKYYRAFLYTETDDNDLTYFLLYHLEIIQKAIKALYAYIARKSEERRDVWNKLEHEQDLNERQINVLSNALKNTHYSLSIKHHQHTYKVVYQTARADLLELEEKGFLKSKKVGRKFVFYPAPDLKRRLEH